MGVCRELWGDMGWSDEIEGDNGLWDELVPKVEWKFRVAGAKPCNDVIFEGLNGSFRHISTVSSCWR